MKGKEAMLSRVLLRVPNSLLNFFFLSVFSLSLQEDIPFPFRNKWCFLSLPPFIILGVLRGLDFHSIFNRKAQFTCMNLLVPAGRLGWIAEQTSGCKGRGVFPTWWAHVWKKTDAPFPSLKLLRILFISGTRFWYIVFELVSFYLLLCSYRYFMRFLGVL